MTQRRSLFAASHSFSNILLVLFGAVFLIAAQTAQAKQAVYLRAGVHPQYARIVFAWPEPVSYQAAITGQQLQITFSSPFTANFDAVSRKLENYVGAPVISDDGKTVQFALLRPFTLQTQLIDRRVVIDLLQAGPETKPAPVTPGDLGLAPRPKPNAAGRQVRFLKGQPAPAPDTEAAEVPAGPVAAPHGADITSERPQAETGAERQRILDAENESKQKAKDAAIAAAMAQAAAEAGETAALGKDGTLDLELRLKELPGGLSLRFPFPADVAGAVFFRGPIMWVVFDKPARTDLRIVALANNPILLSARQIEEEDFTALAFKVAPGYFTRAERRRSVWQIDITNESSQPGKSFAVVREPVSDAGGTVHVISANPAGPFRLLDPYVGDSIIISPVLEAGQAIIDRRRFVGFDLLKSVQGVAIVPFTDQIQVKAGSGTIDISSVSGLHLSDDIARLLGESENGKELPQPPAFMDFDRWKRGGSSTFRSSERQLRAAIAATSLKRRLANQKSLAQFYLAHGLAAESRAVMNIMAAENSSAVNDPAYRALSAAANYIMGRYQEAEKDLADQSLKKDPYASLWRGAVLARLEKWEAALTEFDSGYAMLGKYSQEIQAEMRLLAATAALSRDEFNRAKRELTAFPLKSLPPRQAGWSMLLRGRLLEARGKDDAALKAYDGVIAYHYRPTEAPARLAKVLLLNKLGTLDNVRAIEQLETLQFAWRGDETELKVLEALGDRYIANKDYRSGLSVMRSAVMYFPDGARPRIIADRMSETFADLFLNGASDEMPPVKALALYYDFRELTPLGHDGDEMIRRLGERLVAVDLLDEATELLDHQVRNRLEGTAKAQVAARLAVIQLLDKKPAQALETIRRTRQTRLPGDLTQRRLMLEARALTEMSEFEQALELIAGQTSKEADLLRADIHWAAQDWPQAAASLQVVLGGRWQNDTPLTATEQAQVMRAAIAHALAGQQAALDELRANYKPKMAGGPFDDGFAVITQSADGRGVAFRQLANTIAGLDTLQDFMASYRRDL